ncbi:hypothetical protein HP499_05055 [Paenarthrobacter sp. CM16]|uniref:hypothetical protein n=1 Tax=Paenarthrobacter sp. CM16 TaxID=2738447 RepID=UPI0015531D67|nr:hypothetical protein [Paenarthrobacter sp. CM16]NQD87176.1 hypothetical protein [Paenarthrobacter sp. CM16]
MPEVINPSFGLVSDGQSPHKPQPGRPCPGQQVVPMNPFLDAWLQAIAADGRLPFEALEVAAVMARSVGLGRVAFTDWQRINAALGRNRRDLAVFGIMSELHLEGYLDRNLDTRFGRNYGWSLLIPEEEL